MTNYSLANCKELAEADFDLSLTGFDPRELEDLLTLPDNDEQADVAPPLPENPVSRPNDLWLCGNRRNQHRSPLRGRHQPGSRGATAGRPQAIPPCD